ncbi:MAG: TldD/PmbA family protein [Myxococcota bacterium]|nr:TldD/PmbA family protein [Myxococcota bacterium]
MSKILTDAVERLRGAGVDFGDVRQVERSTEWITAKGERIDTHSVSDERGVCVRAAVDGRWGCAAGVVTDAGSAVRLAEQAVVQAKRRAAVEGRGPEVVDRGTFEGRWASPMVEDPASVSDAEKYDLLLEATAEMSREAQVRQAKATMVFEATDSLTYTTSGSRFEQRTQRSGAGIEAIAVSDSGEVQNRTYPKGHEGGVSQAGYEAVRALDLVANAPRIASEAAQLLTAPLMPDLATTIILHGSQLSLQVHESVGHPLELDRVLGDEISLAGGSFMQRERLGTRYGSELVNLVSDPTTPGALGSYGWDEEGQPAHRFDLVRDGEFKGYLSGRFSSGRADLPSAGTARSDGWAGYPIDRMANVDLEPGTAGTLEQLIADTESGFLLSNNRSWSIDQLRLNFQFGCEIAWEIKDGQLGQMYRNPLYVGNTPEFWGNCDAICGPEAWQSWGWFFCGKGDPMQIAHVGHGVAPARFRNIRVRSA